MIHRVFSSLESFKTLDFRPDLSILLSEKSGNATDQQTRNRTGKSSLVELVHFVFGSDCPPDSIFRSTELLPFSFGLDFDLGEVVRISRSGSEPSKIVVERGDTTTWPEQPRTERETGRQVISNSSWRSVLGRAFFGLGPSDESGGASTGPEEPSFRLLFSYFARRENKGGMRAPTLNHAKQERGDSQIAVSYLIGIDWTIAAEWEQIRKKEKQIAGLKRIVSQGLLSDVLDSAAALRSRLVVAEQKHARNAETLSSFRVHDQYNGLEAEASKLTRQLADLSDENETDRGYVEELDIAMQTESPPAPTDLANLYGEAGVALPDVVRRRYDDVLAFHESVVRNRRSYLEGERIAADERLKVRDLRREALDRRRSELMNILKAYGALDQFIALQSENGRLQAEVETLRKRFEAASQLESTSASLESDRLRLVARLQQDFQERGEVLAEAIRTFSGIVEELYGEAGHLEFDSTTNGPEIRIAIQGDRSRGISNMEIFCFDMMLQRMCARQRIGPGFLLHDSHLFDGVDPRQTARALEIGARLALSSASSMS